MTNATIQKRLTRIEAEVKLLKRAMPRPDFSIDEKNWRNVKATVKKVRAKLYKERYA